MKSLLLLTILTLVILIGMIACRKNLINEEINSDQKSEDVNIAAAKKWYYETFKKSAEWTSYNSARSRTSGAKSQKEPDWEHGIYNKLGNLEITEFPLFSSNTSFSLPAASLTDEEKIKIAKASLSRIAFIKNDKNVITVRVIDYIPEWKYLQKKNFDITNAMYGKPGDDFTGRIFIKNWNDDILSLRMIENGKVTKKGSIKKSTSTHNRSYRLAPGEECQPMEVCVWRQDCVEWYSGETFLYEGCGSWYNTGNCWIEDYCNDGGGGDGDYNDCNITPGPATARIEGSTSETSTGTTTVGECPCEFYGTCTTCDQTLVDKEEQQFNDYTLYGANAVLTITPNLSNNSPDPITGVKTVDIGGGKYASWKIKADVRYGYYHTAYFNGTRMVDSYDLFDFKTSNGYFTGSNIFVKSTYTTTTPTVNQVTNNNTPDCLGTSYVTGTILHKMEITDKVPYCPPMVLEKTENINGTVYFHPK